MKEVVFIILVDGGFALVSIRPSSSSEAIRRWNARLTSEPLSRVLATPVAGRECLSSLISRGFLPVIRDS